MYRRFQDRFGIPGVISVIALVFAMMGGAYAASDSGDDNATASAKKATASATKATALATKAKRGPRGPKGPAGPAGPQGPAGPAGANGKDGAPGGAGGAGANGKSVTSTPIAAGGACGPGVTGVKYTLDGVSTNVCNGAEGEAGAPGPEGEGEPWTAGGTLPPGETLTGVWSAGPLSDGQNQGVPISFALPLPSSLGPDNVHALRVGETPPAGCAGGTAAAPKAEPGHLCVYAREMGPLVELEPESGFFVTRAFYLWEFTGDVNKSLVTVDGNNGADPFGAQILIAAAEDDARAHGSWAVTSPAP